MTEKEQMQKISLETWSEKELAYRYLEVSGWLQLDIKGLAPFEAGVGLIVMRERNALAEEFARRNLGVPQL